MYEPPPSARGSPRSVTLSTQRAAADLGGGALQMPVVGEQQNPRRTWSEQHWRDLAASLQANTGHCNRRRVPSLGQPDATPCSTRTPVCARDAVGRNPFRLRHAAVAAPRWLGQRLLADSVTAPAAQRFSSQSLPSLTNCYGVRQFGFTEIVYELAVLFLSKHPSADGLVRLSP